MGAITEVSGPECSGRSTLALSFLAQRTREGKVCAWIDATNAFQPVVAAASRIDLSRLLWVRCGAMAEVTVPARASFQLPEECLTAPPVKRGLYGGGWGAHPRSEVKGIADAISGRMETPAAHRLEQKASIRREVHSSPDGQFSKPPKRAGNNPWDRLNQALLSIDRLFESGGFSAIVLDMGGVTPEYSSRIPLATWFRYRAAAERSQSSILLLSQQPCAKSSAGLVLRLSTAESLNDEGKVFTGLKLRMEVDRQRFALGNVVPLREGPFRETVAHWGNRFSWAGRR
jgi:hypothetical protein